MPSERRWDDERATGPYGPVAELLPENQTLVWVDEDDSLLDALRLLCEHRYLQAPARGGNRCVGVLRVFDALRKVLDMDPFKGALCHVKVGDYLDLKPTYANPRGAVDESIDWRHDGYSLVGTPNDVTGILTAADLLNRLRHDMEAFVLLGYIEGDIRRLFDLVLPLPASRDLIIQAIVDTNRPPPPNFGSYADLRWDHYCAIFGKAATFERIDASCTWDKSKLARIMPVVRDIRNTVVHFKARAKAEQIALLKEVATLMSQACDRAEAARTPASSG